MKKVLITLGSTGGHIFPGISILNKLESTDNKIEVRLVNSKHSKISIPKLKNNNKIYKINSTGFIGKRSFDKIKSIIFLIKSIISSTRILFEFKPDAVIGTGGFVSLPIAIVSFFLNKKIYIIEGNSVPGLSNKIISLFCKKIFINFKESEKYFTKKKCIRTGFPIRELKTNKSIKKNIDILLLGGSQGSTSLNKKFIDSITLVLKKTKEVYGKNIPIKIVHQCGVNNKNEIEKSYLKIKNNYKHLEYETHDFIENIDEYYQRCKILISRAGASTISESLFYQIPTIYFPISSSSGNHQYLNAKEISKKNLGLIHTSDDSIELLSNDIYRILYDEDFYNTILESIRKDGYPNVNSATRIIEEVYLDFK